MPEAALVANLAATWMMVGVIWFVQRVHYPLLALVGTERASRVALQHQSRTAQVVAVPMAIEGVSTLILLVDRPAAVNWALPWCAAVLLAVALCCTVLLSVPLHTQMAAAPTTATGQRLVRTNWPRTIAWTTRGALVAIMAVQAWA